MSKRRTAGVIGGAGFWGVRYLRAFADHPGCDPVCIADTAADRRERYADHFGIPGRYDDAEAMLAAEQPDIVSVVLPVAVSYGAVMRCLDANVSVVTCEKPIADTLSKADRMVETARSTDTPLFCGTALWEIPHLSETIDWLRTGPFGDLVGASIPSGFNDQISGNGCVLFTLLRFITGREIDWVEGYTVPPEAAFKDDDCNAHGVLGLIGDVECIIAKRDVSGPIGDCVSARFENGQVWLTRRGIVLIEGANDQARPVFPDFLGESVDTEQERVQCYLDACTARGEAPCSAHDYRQALEAAIALKMSARDGHRRVALPLAERDLSLLPHPYRQLGGDVVGWDSIGLHAPSLGT